VLVSEATAYALRLAGVLGTGQVALAQYLADATTALGMMLAQWQRKRWLVFRLDEVSTYVTPGVPYYTIGPSGHMDYPQRPGSIESGYLRQLTGPTAASFPVDYPLERISSREEWGRISLKSLRSWPSAFFYDPTLPDGVVYIWPIPMQNFFQLHFMIPVDIAVWLQPYIELDQFLPAETEEALISNLALRLRIMYQLPPDPALAAMARASLNTMRQANYTASRLGMPAGLGRGGRIKNPMGGFYNETAVGIPTQVFG
jgi:hypothetical protein